MKNKTKLLNIAVAFLFSISALAPSLLYAENYTEFGTKAETSQLLNSYTEPEKLMNIEAKMEKLNEAIQYINYEIGASEWELKVLD
ncbi:MAG TPA: hypothetical protein VMW66_00360, partial [Elusimicrobiales bacterium]|nr:hypothetical protein [Elusimicrobiales bacterium]